MKLSIPTRWSETTAWQRKEITHLLLSLSCSQEGEPQKIIIRLLKILVMHSPTFWSKIRWIKLLQQVPISALFPYAEHFLQQRDLYEFPNISPKLITPGARMNNCCIKQFSVCDAIYYKYRTTNNQQQKQTYAKQLVASLYVLKGNNFDSLKLPEVAKITDTINKKIRHQIIFTFMCIREYITGRFPKIFPTKKTLKEQEQPIFHKTTSYTPFSKVIQSMAMDERQPLGNLHQCNDTLIYDFLDMLQESIIRMEMQNK